MQTAGSIEIDRPIDDVFRLTNEHITEWSNIVVEDEVLNKTPEGVGTTFRTVTEEKGKRMEFAGVVTEYDPPRHTAVQMTGDMFDLDVEYTFDDLGGRTRVTQRSQIKGKGWVKVMFFLFGWMMNKSSCNALENEFESLKRFCESQPVAAGG
ncbi:MAG: SRPBCC family protein [Aeoliella sp.]